MSRFKSVGRTVVTEIKSFVVDTVSRTGTFRQSVSARISDDIAFQRQDVNVSSEHPYVLDDVSVVAGINTPEPVRVVLTQLVPTTPPEEPDDTPVPPSFETPDYVYAGDLLPIVLRDDSLRSVGMVNIVALNLVTGETETLLLRSDEPGVFKGDLQTILSASKSMDFDGNMGVRNGHTVLFRHNSSAESPTETTVAIKSQYVDSSITTPALIFPGRPIPVIVEDSDLIGRVLSVTLLNLSTGQEFNPILNEIAPGVFYTQIETSDVVDDPSKMMVADGQAISVSFTSDRFADEATVEDIVNVRAPHHVPVRLTIDTDVSPGEKMLVVLDDYNRAGASSIAIAVSNTRTRAFIMVTCVESVPNSGQFIGELSTRLGSSREGILGVEPGDTVQAVYVDTSGEEPLRLEADGIITDDSAASPASLRSLSIATEETTEASVEFIVNGLFFLNGSFNGQIRVYGLTEERVRCSILHA